MNKFVKWVNKHRTKDEYNFLSMLGGKFKIDDRKTFFKLLNREYVKLPQKKAFPLVFRGPKNASTPFYLDIDLKLKTDVSIPTQIFIDLADDLLVVLQKVTGCGELSVIITRRTGSYQAKDLFKNGFHVLIPNLLVTPCTMKKFRAQVLSSTTWMFRLKPFGVLNKPNEIIDGSITTRRNGLILLGLNKPLLKDNKPCSPHYVCFFHKWDGDWGEPPQALAYGWQFSNKNKNDD